MKYKNHLAYVTNDMYLINVLENYFAIDSENFVDQRLLL